MAIRFKVDGNDVGYVDDHGKYHGDSSGDGKFHGMPFIKTDKAFLAGRSENEIHGPVHLWRIKQAESAGVSTTGKVYCSGLARFPGDPEAWVSNASDVRRVAEKNNYNVTGMVEYKARECEPIGSIDIADDILDRRVMARLAEDPESDRDQIREEEKALATGQVDPHPPRVSDHWFGQEH